MPSLDFAVNQTAPIAGNAASKQLVAASAGNAIFAAQLVIAGTANDSTIILQDASGGTTLLGPLSILANTTLVLPCNGAWWARTTIGNGLFFTAAATTTVTAYYLVR